MSKTRTQKNRLKKWADSLRSVKTTKTAKFAMETFWSDLYKTTDGKITADPYDNAGNNIKASDEPCGYAACAVGWLPFFFPKEFTKEEVQDGGIEEHACEFFGITEDEFSAIAYFDSLNEEGDEDVNFDKLTPKQVAKRIDEVAADKHLFVETETCRECGHELEEI